MCGHCGIYRYKGQVDTDTLVSMNSKIRHRGPDDEGYLLYHKEAKRMLCYSGEESSIGIKEKYPLITNSNQGDLAFGFRRLSILDLSDLGHQPMLSEDNKVAIVFNGEIYNYKEIRQELIELGYVFKSDSDTEVLLNSYIHWGEDCVRKFNGMWAFAIWDSRDQKLFCSRDRFGIKPFYYSSQEGYFTFGSEIKSLLELVKPQVNEKSVYNYLQHNSVDESSDTFFEGINQLRPGYNLVIANQKMDIYQYYSLTPYSKRQSLDQTTEMLSKALKNAVALRLRSDVKVGYALSGGLDSSSIVANAVSLNKQGNHSTFSIVYPNMDIDESIYVKSMVERYSLENYTFSPSSAELIHDLKDFVLTQEEPIMDLSYYNDYKLRQLVRNNKVIVSLEGQGADEIITGYRQFVESYLMDLLVNFKFKKLHTEKKNFKSLQQLTYGHLIKRLVIAKTPGRLKQVLFPWLKNRNRYLGKKFASKFRFQYHPLTRHLKGEGYLQRDLYSSLIYESIPRQLVRGDKNAMAASTEARFPFLDKELVEFCFSMDNDFKMKEGVTKFILRKIGEDALPKEIIERRDKIGFVSPQKQWILEQKKYFDSIIYTDEFRQFKYIDYEEFIEDYTKLEDKSSNISSNEIWKIIGLFLWYKYMVK